MMGKNLYHLKLCMALIFVEECYKLSFGIHAVLSAHVSHVFSGNKLPVVSWRTLSGHAKKTSPALTPIFYSSPQLDAENTKSKRKS